jgi:3-hydroxyisobutyrate dehydrogenase-like beta-hydroxyacid dehydrogenase
MAKNLSLKGNLESPITVWNRTVAKAEKLRDRPVDCKIAESVADAVTNSDIIFSCLASDEATIAVYEEVFKVDVTGKLLVSCETITPESSEKLAGIAARKGAGFVSMPGKFIKSGLESVFRTDRSVYSIRRDWACGEGTCGMRPCG